MRAIGLILAWTIAVCAQVATAQDAPPSPDTCFETSKSQADFLACEHARTDPGIDAALAAQRQREAAAKPLGSWMVESGQDAQITATADTSDNGGARLRIICDSNSGFSIMFFTTQHLGIDPKPATALLIDNGAPTNVEAERFVEEIATPPVIVRHAESVEKALLHSHTIGFRIDSPYSGTKTYHFAFADLAAGKSLVLKTCPA